MNLDRVCLTVSATVTSLAVLLAVSACSSGSTSPSNTVSTSEAQEVGASTASEITASVSSLSASQAMSSGGAVASASTLPRAQTASINTGCGVASPSPIVDTDGDGVPDSITITYALPACEFVGARGVDTLSVIGALTVTDPTPTTASASFNSSASNLQFAFAHGTFTASETRNGTRAVTQTNSVFGQSNDMTTVFDSAGTTVGTLVNTLSGSFTAANGSSLSASAPLPNGTYTANGTLSWTSNEANDSFAVSTIVPLAYDASCGTSAASPFDSGELRASVSTAGKKGYVRIIWANCAAPTILLVAS